jgi:DNA-binding XRE family transcriptional regulator
VSEPIDHFADWLGQTKAYLRVRSLYGRVPAGVQRFMQEMEEAALRSSATEDEREQACAALAATCMAHGSMKPPEKSPAGAGQPTSAVKRLTAFGDRLRALRKEKRLTQEQLARRAGVRQSAISMMESGQCRPQPSTLDKLAAELGVAVEELWPNGRSSAAPRNGMPR